MITYGKQELSISSLSLTLENCDFRTDPTPHGYQRRPGEEFLPEYNYSIFGVANVKQNYNETGKFSYKWSLQLTSTKLSLLNLIVTEQRRRFSTRTANPEVTFKDSRLAIAETTGSFSRTAWVSSGTALPTTALPSGFSWYFPSMYIGLEGDGVWLAVEQMQLEKDPSSWLYYVDLEAKEL